MKFLSFLPSENSAPLPNHYPVKGIPGSHVNCTPRLAGNHEPDTQGPYGPQAVYYDIHPGPLVFLIFSEMLSGHQELKLINEVINEDVREYCNSSNIQFTI
ncbi:hypothetical protein L0665_02705 [Methanogenium marinum]|uniref:Uncharacterized protein n=1 Tax=Methanogenium marinum TaxID=348610 RepID=A0A9Q4PYA7_9EURY|nr:hypothetical protein [Methanogenium marinum]MDE4907527.1 hypothetical protein [Methanogenium marinum]